MRGQDLKERPGYGLLKQGDIVRFTHLQFPRWLMEDRRYMPISLEAKFAYMLLFNRFQLSRHNGWINGEGEVFVIYTRRELAEKLGVNEKRVSAAMNELKAYNLVWEKRCGRGFANQIYLASVEISEMDAEESFGGPFDPLPEESRTAESEVLDGEEPVDNVGDNREIPVSKEDFSVQKQEEIVDNMGKPVDSPDRYGENLSPNNLQNAPEPPGRPFQNRQNGGSKTEKTAVQEPPNPPPSLIEKRKIENSVIESQSMSKTGQDAGAREVRRLVTQSGANFLPGKQADVMRQAIERLYYTQSLKVGDAVYPNAVIRQNLERLDYNVLQAAIGKITANTDRKIRNSSAYIVAVLFNSIMEVEGDLLVDPYLNALRQLRKGGG